MCKYYDIFHYSLGLSSAIVEAWQRYYQPCDIRLAGIW